MVSEKYLSSPSSYRIQKTIRTPVELSGIGLHTGAVARLRINPSEANTGITFIKKDLKKSVKIPAHYDSIVCTELATSLGIKGRPETQIATVEHLLSAIFALGITNLTIEIWGPEIPILDGSASKFVQILLGTGFKLQPYTTPVLKVKKPIKTYALKSPYSKNPGKSLESGAVCELLPRDRLRLTASIDFNHPQIGLQTFALELSPAIFKQELAEARTFGFVADLDRLRERHLALGASLENVLAFTEEGTLNPEGNRFRDECVRHKLLDCIGDLALCGSWIEAELVSYRGGHSVHHALLKTLKSHQSNWELIPAERIPINTPLTRSHAVL